jgi:hypothetical protein
MPQLQRSQSSAKPAGEIVNTPSWYVADADGTVELSVATRFIGTKRGSLYFGTSAQLYSASGSDEQRADVSDPLEGADDCGVRRNHSVGSASAIEWRNVESAVLADQDEEYSYELQLGSSRTFFNYGIDLTAQGVAPRFRGTYGFRAVGGSFGKELSVEGIELPEPLSIRELESASHIPRGPLHLTWTGRNDQPLRLLVYISPQPMSDVSYELECLMKDDGEFEIPDEVMQAVPDGIANMQFFRAKRRLLHDQDRAILAIASINVAHQLAYGDRCDRASVIDTCQRYAEQMHKVYSDCGQPVPDLDELCPDYLAEACTVCPEYFECMSKATTCENNQVTHRSGCSCPK